MPLRRSVLILVFVGLFTPAVVSGVIQYFQLHQEIRSHFWGDKARLENILVYGTQELLWNFDQESAVKLVESVMTDPRVLRVVITEPDGTVFLQRASPVAASSLAVVDARSIRHEGGVIGTLRLTMDPASDYAAIGKQLLPLVAGLVLQLVFSLVLIYVFLNRQFLLPVKRLEEQSTRLANQDLDKEFTWIAHNELGKLGSSLEVTRRSLRAYRENLEALVQERTAELQAANRELEAFSYSVSHDLQAPLRAIDGYATAVEEDFAPLLPPTAQEYLRKLRRGVSRMSSLISDLLALSRVTRSPMRRVDVDLAVLADQVITELREAEPAREVDFWCERPLTAVVDPGLMKAALRNLLGNAWKYTSKTVGAQIRLTSSGGTRPIFTVGDNGAGFSMQDVPKLFQAFQRLHDASDYPGNGIGLALVQRVITRHGGQIWAEGEPGRGARFSFWLGTPLVEKASEEGL